LNVDTVLWSKSLDALRKLREFGRNLAKLLQPAIFNNGYESDQSDNGCEWISLMITTCQQGFKSIFKLFRALKNLNKWFQIH
jgi:hypothetical protein